MFYPRVLILYAKKLLIHEYQFLQSPQYCLQSSALLIVQSSAPFQNLIIRFRIIYFSDEVYLGYHTASFVIRQANHRCLQIFHTVLNHSMMLIFPSDVKMWIHPLSDLWVIFMNYQSQVIRPLTVKASMSMYLLHAMMYLKILDLSLTANS